MRGDVDTDVDTLVSRVGEGEETPVERVGRGFLVSERSEF
jgi:hypothetical protein